MNTVVALLYPGCVSYDVALVCELLARKFKIQVATADGQTIALASGLPIHVQSAFADVDLSQCRALLIPGGDVKNAPLSHEMLVLVKQAQAQKLFILAIGEGVQVLKAAGVDVPDLSTGTELYAFLGSTLVARADGSIDAAVELGARLDALDARFVTRTKDHYRGLAGRKIRALALAVIEDEQGRYLLHEMYDAKRKQVFYRPVGGGIDFHEPARLAVVREIQEELGFEIVVEDLLKTFENIFVIEDLKGHEMVSVFKAHFKDKSVYKKNEIAIQESGRVVSKAVWKTPAEIKDQGAALYPLGIESILTA